MNYNVIADSLKESFLIRKKKSLLLTVVTTLGLTAATMAQNVPSYVPTNGLVGWWPFNGNANDESGNGNHGTVNGATLTSDRFGFTNSSFNFNGVNNYISIQADILPVSTRTISVWFYSTNIGQGQLGRAVLGYGGLSCTQGRGWLMILDNPGHINSLNTYEINSICNIFSITSSYGLTPPNGAWHNWVVSTSSAGTTFYLDGLQILNNSLFVNNTQVLGRDFYIGTYPNNNGIGPDTSSSYNTPWNGKLDDIGIWNRALTQQEITDLYNATNCANNTTITPPTNTLQTGNTASFTASTSDSNPSFVWQSNLGQGFQTLNTIENYSGTNTATLSITNVQLSNHNQPIRVITTSGNCIDTSNIAIITIADTCINSVTDTNLVTVTDTLLINTSITGLNPPGNTNTIKIFPNPTNDHITIHYGNFPVMTGYQLRIENSLGQQVFQTNIVQQSDYLSLANWGGNGLYFVHIIDPLGNTIDIRKIVLQ